MASIGGGCVRENESTQTLGRYVRLCTAEKWTLDVNLTQSLCLSSETPQSTACIIWPRNSSIDVTSRPCRRIFVLLIAERGIPRTTGTCGVLVGVLKSELRHTRGIHHAPDQTDLCNQSLSPTARYREEYAIQTGEVETCCSRSRSCDLLQPNIT